MEPSITRYFAFYATILAMVAFIFLGLYANVWWFAAALMSASLTLLGISDLVQTRHAIKRNYPVIGNLRYFFEMIRPEMRQYFFENDNDKSPFSRTDRSLVYQRAKEQVDKRPLGHKATSIRQISSGSTIRWRRYSQRPVIFASA